MKAITVLLAVGLMISLGWNVSLWRNSARERAEAESLRASAVEADALRAELDEAKKARANQSAGAEDEKRELARLRNEVAQLRKQTKEAEVQRVRMAAQNAALTASQVNNKTPAQAIDTNGWSAEDIRIMETAKLTPEQVVALRSDAQATACVSNMKQIGLSLRMWANDHQDTFPPQLLAATNELNSPRVLVCPAATGASQVRDWAQLSPGAISYQYLNPGGNESDPQKPLLTCPIHGHMGYSDGSVRRKQANSP
jgi:hypothetical protein